MILFPVMEHDNLFTSRDIPPEIFANICSFLPVKSLLKFRSVSKEWKSMIDSPDFARQHLNHHGNKSKGLLPLVLEVYYGGPVRNSRARWFVRGSSSKETDDESSSSFRHIPEFDTPLPTDLRGAVYFIRGVVIAGSVDGLLLVQKTLGTRGTWALGDVFLWNPSIRRWLNLPPPPSISNRLNLCLGFDPSTSDYKVVSILPDSEKTATFYVFSLNSGTWRRGCCGNGGGETHRWTPPDAQKVLLDGSLHWVAGDLNGDQVFVSFSLISETFSYTPLPDFSYEQRVSMIPVLVAGSTVGLLTFCCESGDTDIWVLERTEDDDDDDVGSRSDPCCSCWSIRFSFRIQIGELNLNGPLYLSKDGVLIWLSVRTSGLTFLCSHDTNTGLETVVSDCGWWWPVYIGDSVHSLLLMKNGEGY